MPQSSPRLPVIKVPALNIIDQYVVDTASQSRGYSETIELPCCHDSDVIQGYARFVARFTGLEEVTFVVNRNKNAHSPEKAIVHAVEITSLDSSIYQWQELHTLPLEQEETQFVLDFESREPEPEAWVASSYQEDVSVDRSLTICPP